MTLVEITIISLEQQKSNLIAQLNLLAKMHIQEWKASIDESIVMAREHLANCDGAILILRNS